MKLYLMQHGEACAKDVDPERPLSDQGKAEVEQLAAFLGRAGIQVDRVLHSNKLRAKQTAKSMAYVIAPAVELEVSDLINPSDNPKAFDWQSESWDEDTLIVSHLPFVSRLVSHLLLDDPDRPVVEFQPGSIVCLEKVDNQWSLTSMIRPDLVI